MHELQGAGRGPVARHDAADEPPAYDTFLSWSEAPPSYPAGQLDLVWNEIERCDPHGPTPEILVHRHMEALGHLIEERGLSGEVRARARRLLHRPMLATLSGLMHGSASSHLPGARPGYRQAAAFQSCVVLTTLLEQRMLQGNDVLDALTDDSWGRPLLLSMASLARTQPRVSHVMCTLLATILSDPAAHMLTATLRRVLMRLDYPEPDGDKYSSFWDRLVRDGRSSDAEAGGAIAIERLKPHGLWPSPVELKIQGLSSARVEKRSAAAHTARSLRAVVPDEFTYTPEEPRQQGGALAQAAERAQRTLNAQRAGESRAGDTRLPRPAPGGT